MLKSERKFNKDYLLTLARNRKYEEGIKLIEGRIKKIGSTTELLLQEAFFQYHHAADLKYNNPKKNLTNDLEIINDKFKHALKICREIIENKKIQHKNHILNARLYLAQIYAMLGNVEKGKSLAKQTFKLFPTTLTAERTADVHLRLNDTKGAICWYKKSIKLARKIPEKIIARLGLAIAYKKRGLLDKANKMAVLALQISKRARKNINVILLTESLYFHFPNLRNEII